MVDDARKSNNSIEKLIAVKRHSKTVKGGRIMSFSALVAVGNGKGRVGIGRGRSREVPVAIQKAMDKARRGMVFVNLNNSTIWYTNTASCGASKVFMKPAVEGTGIIAGGTMRAIFEAVGVHNVLAKAYGSTNVINVALATLKAMIEIKSPQEIFLMRS